MSITSIDNAKRTLSMIVAVAAALATVSTGRAQTGYRPTAANLAAREWFQDARFGLFVHWTEAVFLPFTARLASSAPFGRTTRRRAGPPQLRGPRRRPSYERAAQKL